MATKVWVVLNNGEYQVFTNSRDAENCSGTIFTAPLDPQVVSTYRVVATMHSNIGWKATLYGKAGASKVTGWNKYGEHGCTTYQWDVQATSPKEAIEMAKQLFRDSI